jgi:hypothetical protein
MFALNRRADLIKNFISDALFIFFIPHFLAFCVNLGVRLGALLKDLKIPIQNILFPLKQGKKSPRMSSSTVSSIPLRSAHSFPWPNSSTTRLRGQVSTINIGK